MPPDPTFPDLATAADQALGMLTPMEYEALQELVAVHGVPAVYEALRQAVAEGKRVSYAMKLCTIPKRE